MFTKEHYEEIARLFRNFRTPPRYGKYENDTADEILELVVVNLSAMLQSDNEKFDPDKFWKACGL